MALNEGDKAPVFTLPADSDQTFNLSDHLGSKIVLYFYPKDDTPGCTNEAKDFSERLEAFKTQGAVVVGMSPDTPKKHDKFKAKYELSITLVSDEEKSVLEDYGVFVEKKMYGRTYMGVERTTMLINEAGIIEKIWPKVKVKGHAEEVLQYLSQGE